MDSTQMLALTDAIYSALADPAFNHGSPSVDPLSSPTPIEHDT
jgi:hypothetical protein